MTGLLNRRLYLRRLSSRWGKGNRMEFGDMLWQDSSASLKLKGPLLWGSHVLDGSSQTTFPHKTRSPQGQDGIPVERYSLSRPCSSRHWDPVIPYPKSSKSVSRACAGLFPQSTFWRKIMLSKCTLQGLGASPGGLGHPCAFITDPLWYRMELKAGRGGGQAQATGWGPEGLSVLAFPVQNSEESKDSKCEPGLPGSFKGLFVKARW